MTRAVAPLVQRLEAAGRSLSLETALEALAQTPLELEGLLPQVRFSPRSYRPALVWAAANFQLYAVGWLPSQRTTIHDHGGSHCAVRVLRGEATEARFHAAPLSEGVRPGTLRAFRTGEVFGIEDGIHLIANLSSEQLITLHFYSPGVTLLRSYPWHGTQPVEGSIAL